MKTASFTSQVKEELTTKPYDATRRLAMLAGFVKNNGRFSWTKTSNKLRLTTPYPKIAQFMYETTELLFSLKPHFEYKKGRRFSKRRTYEIVYEQGVDTILEAIHLDFESSDKDYLAQFSTNDLIAGYMGGLFLASGSVNHPESSHYHLEMASDDEDLLQRVISMLKKVKNMHVNFQLIERKNKWVLYLKKSDQIADFLIFLGATDATLDYENIRVARDFSNSENRLQICETANMQKTIDAARRQIEDIHLIDRIIGLNHLDHPKLVKLAQLRLEHDSSSLDELSSMMKHYFPNAVSKSNLNHLFRSLHQLAEKLRGQPRA